MGLSLVAGPANAGKVALLLDRYLEAIALDPVLIVPGRPDVVRVGRELLRRTPAVLGGSVGTFDDLFRRIAAGDPGRRRTLSGTQRALAIRRAVAATPLGEELGSSALHPGFADALADSVGELAAGLVPPEALAGPTRALYAAYLAELDRLDVWDRDAERTAAVRRLEHDLSAWHGQPLFAYGFEDLTAAQWRLLEALAGRCEVTVSLPYEAGRPAFASLERTAGDLAALADGRVTWLAPAYALVAPPPLAHLERALFADTAQPAPPALDGSIRWLEAAGDRATAELVAEASLDLIRGGQAPDEIAVVCASVERVRAPLETAFATLGVPLRVDAPTRLERTPFGKALLALLRFGWGAPTRRDLFRFLRSPYSGLTRAHVDFLEGRLRGRAIRDEHVEDEAVSLRGAPLPHLDLLRAQADPVAGARGLAAAMLRGAYGLDAPPAHEHGRGDLRAFESVRRVLDELDDWASVAGPVARDDALAALERAMVPPPGGAATGCVAVLDLMRARTIRADVVFVLGLEGGSMPRRGAATPFLADDVRRELDAAARLARPDAAARDRYLFYTACTRASKRLLLVRAAATDDGAPREASPFWEETRALYEPNDVVRWTNRRSLAALTWPLEAAPTERERVRALAVLAAADPDAATALALSNGWERRLERALTAFERPTRLTHPAVLDELNSRSTFGVTELERFADCSSMWLVERLVSPRSIDAEVDARLRGSVAHTTLHRFFAGLPKRLGTERVDAERLDDALAFLRECLDEALAGVRLDMSDLERLELQGGLWRDLEGLARAEAELETPLVPRRFELSFGNARSAPELQRGLDLGGFTLSGKIDRIDVDPFGARAIVQDYKSGASAPSAAKIESELRLQIPLYMLVLRDLVGLEPLGGVYRPLAGKREPRGLIRADENVPGFHRNDYVDDEEFWRHVDVARERAVAIVDRMRGGDVRHDPKGGDCPEWCELWSSCRIRRA